MPVTLKNLPTFEKEITLLQQGCNVIAGIDESGKSSIAGPITAAALAFPLPGVQDPDFKSKMSAFSQVLQVRDSKRLTEYHILKKVYNLILSVNPVIGIGIVPIEELNDIKNDDKAAILASRRAYFNLTTKILPDYLLFDNGLAFEDPTLPTNESLIKGDSTSLTIAAASVVAKYTFDTWMITQSNNYPAYKFENHKGYPNGVHPERLNQFGPTPIHREYHKLVKAVRHLKSQS